MIKSNELAFGLLKRLSLVVAAGLGAVISYGGGIYATKFFPSTFSAIFQFMYNLVPYKILDRKITIAEYILPLIVFTISLIFLIKAFQKFITLALKDPKLSSSSWQEHGKNHFATGFWAGLCLFVFVFFIVMPILSLLN